jgi:hypothetical protein
MLGAHSMVIRVNADGSMMPFELMPELFLGRSIRQLLSGDVRDQFESACQEVIATESPLVFAPEPFGETDEVMITPVLDDAGLRCQFLVVWARRLGDDAEPAHDEMNLHWHDLTIDAVETRFRAIAPNTIEAAPWWAVGEGLELWDHQHRVAAVGLGAEVMTELVADAIPVLADHSAVTLRIDLPAAEMLPGLIQTIHGSLRATGVDASRIELGVPVGLAVDPDLLPVIVHLRTLGLRIDIVGLDALTAKLHTVSDTSAHCHDMPSINAASRGAWSSDPEAAIRESAQL